MKTLQLHAHNVRVMGLLLLAALIATSGITTLPMDGHEAFVVQTTHEMQIRNDWVVPWHNDEPRLNKPPLNYWLTGVVALVTGTLDHIGPWHGRLISALAAMAMAILTYFAAKKLYSRRVAVLSAFFLATSLGYFNYSHDARPDMLYAALCTAGYVAFVFAWKTTENRRQMIFIMLMWFGYALATLSKGPHMPAMYLVASIIFCWWINMPWRESLRLFRPVAGLILCVSVTLPWWLLVQNSLGGNSLEGTQLMGSLLTRIRFDQLFDFYYFYRPLILVLPWLIFLPHGILRIRHAQNNKESDRLLLLYILTPALVLSFGSQQRWFYMLPSLPLLIMVLAAGADDMLTKRADPQRSYRQLLTLCLATGIFYTIAGYLHFGWSKERYEFQTLAQHAQALQRPDTQVYTLRLHPDVFVYYLQPRIRQEQTIYGIVQDLKARGLAHALIIMQSDVLSSLPTVIPHKVIYSTRAQTGKELSLVLLNSN